MLLSWESSSANASSQFVRLSVPSTISPWIECWTRSNFFPSSLLFFQRFFYFNSLNLLWMSSWAFACYLAKFLVNLKNDITTLRFTASTFEKRKLFSMGLPSIKCWELHPFGFLRHITWSITLYLLIYLMCIDMILSATYKMNVVHILSEFFM